MVLVTGMDSVEWAPWAKVSPLELVRLDSQVAQLCAKA
jgi:hypothetical protein